MKYLYSAFILSFLIVSCKEDGAIIISPPADQVKYRMEVRLTWSAPQFSIPASNPHFTYFIGMLHNKNSYLWKPNGLATGGLEFVAEVGSNERLNNEIDSIISRGGALLRFGIPPPAITGGFDTNFTFTRQFSAISFASMIAPSPDWFVGLNNYDLLSINKWVEDVTIPLYLYDAGTEDGDLFGYNNPASSPQQPVSLLTPSKASVLANGNTTLASIGSARFIKL